MAARKVVKKGAKGARGNKRAAPASRSKPAARKAKTKPRRKAPSVGEGTPQPVVTRPLGPADTRAVAPPAPASQPGHPSVVPGRPAVPPRPNAQALLAWNNVLRFTSAAARMYRPFQAAEGGPTFPCDGCDVDCCSGQRVPLHVVDVARLSRTLNLAASEFTELIPWRQGFVSHPIAWGAERRALVLRQRPDHSCAFLVRVGPHRRCGVHGLRPDACRIFPFVPDLTVQASRRGNNLLQLHPSACPWQWPNSDGQRQEILDLLNVNQQHLAMDRELLAQWEGEPREADFYAWLEQAMDEASLEPRAPA